MLTYALIALGIILLLFLLSKAADTSPEATGGALSAEVTVYDHIKGDTNAPVTIVEYSDFQCPACASMYPLLHRLESELSGTVRIVYRHYPLRQIHAQAQMAAQAAEAAAKQDKFFEMHDMLFNTQRQWSENAAAGEFFVALAGSLGLQTDQFIADMNNPQTRDAVNTDAKTGDESNVNSTPTLFLNGEKIADLQGYADLKARVEAAAE